MSSPSPSLGYWSLIQALVYRLIQQTVGSHYLAAQNALGNKAFVTTTSLYTLVDEIVQPEIGPSATSIVSGATNIFLQGEIKPGRRR